MQHLIECGYRPDFQQELALDDETLPVSVIVNVKHICNVICGSVRKKSPVTCPAANYEPVVTFHHLSHVNESNKVKVSLTGRNAALVLLRVRGHGFSSGRG